MPLLQPSEPTLKKEGRKHRDGKYSSISFFLFMNSKFLLWRRETPNEENTAKIKEIIQPKKKKKGLPSP